MKHLTMWNIFDFDDATVDAVMKAKGGPIKYQCVTLFLVGAFFFWSGSACLQKSTLMHTDICGTMKREDKCMTL